MSTPEARVRRLAECGVALAVIAVFVGLLVHNLVFRSYAEFPRPTRNGDNYAPVLARLERSTPRSLSIYFGFAAWDAGDGGVTTILAPADLNALSPRTPDLHTENGAVSAFNVSFIQQASGAHVQGASYETTLTPEQIQVLRGSLKERRYPKDVIAFIAKKPESRVVAYTDSSRMTIYVVPFSASPLGGRP